MEKQTKTRQKIEYKQGKILYEEILTDLIRQANKAFKTDKQKTFARTIQEIWDNLYTFDRKQIQKLVEKKYNKEHENQYDPLSHKELDRISQHDFNRLVNGNLNSVVGLTAYTTNKQVKWRKIHRIVQEYLRRKYQGDTREFTKDQLEGDQTIEEQEIDNR